MSTTPISAYVVNSAATGRGWFVNELTGNDANNGSSLSPFATLAAALSAARVNTNDVVYLMGSSHRSTTLNWNKAGVSLVGLTAPSGNCRARISTASGLTQTQVTALFPLVNVTAQGCAFVNIGTFYGFDGVLTPPAASVCWAEAGGRNYYSNVQFLGGGDALMAALAGMRSLTIAGSGENKFSGCTIGLDTISRATAANSSLELLLGTARNEMNNCVFRMLTSLNTDVHIHVGAAGMDRDLLLNNCSFLNAVDSTGTEITAAITADNAAGGSVVLNGGISIGAGVIAASGPVYVNGAVPVATTSSIGIKAT